MRIAKTVAVAICVLSMFGCGIIADGLVYKPRYDSGIASLVYNKGCNGKTIVLLSFLQSVISPSKNTYKDSVFISGKWHTNVVQADSIPASVIREYQKSTIELNGKLKVVLLVEFYPRDRVLLSQCDSVLKATVQKIEVSNVVVGNTAP